MKASAFDYVRARSLEEALDLLGRHGEDAKIIAGGQSLVPALNLRLVAPSLLIDIGGLSERSIANMTERATSHVLDALNGTPDASAVANPDVLRAVA